MYSNLDRQSPVGPGQQPPAIEPDVLEALLREGLDPDLALLPFQMPRIRDNLTEQILSEEDVEEQPPPLWTKSSCSLSIESLSIESSDSQFRLCGMIDALGDCELSVLLSNSSTPDSLPDSKSISCFRCFAGIGQSFFVDFKQELLSSGKKFLVILLSGCEDRDLNFEILKQITFLDVIIEEEHVSLHVERQLVEFQGEYFVVQELFGRGRMRKASSERAVLEDKEVESAAVNTAECIICFSAPCDTVVLPCRHFCLCTDCSKSLRRQSKKCPICRSCKSYLWAYLADLAQTYLDS